jgi:hypothetical protein
MWAALMEDSDPSMQAKIFLKLNKEYRAANHLTIELSIRKAIAA